MSTEGKELVARQPILVDTKQYQTGDVLPSDSPLASEWVSAGSAFWRAIGAKKKAPRAIPVTAPIGEEGLSSTGDPNDMIGRINQSDRPGRERKRK